MRGFIQGLLLLCASGACLAGNDVWETLFRETLREARSGSSTAQCDVGAMYQNGRGVAANREKAIEWYRKAAAQGNRQAISRLKLIQGNEARFNRTLARARQGDAESRYDLGGMYAEGIGVAADMEMARDWYGKAASQGFVKAQYKLGLLHYQQGGTARDQALAFRLFSQAAAKNNPAAQYYLGKMYASGQGVKRDDEKALEWFSKAADGGFGEAHRAMIDLAELLEDRAEDKPAGAAQARDRHPSSPRINASSYRHEDLMRASWHRDDRPVAYLPSTINNCRLENEAVICISGEQLRTTAAGSIRFKTMAITGGITGDDSFEVAYRNLVIGADQESTRAIDSEEVVGGNTAGTGTTDYPVKTGWGKEHKLQCRFRDRHTLSCLKDKTHAFLLHGPQTLAAGK